MPGRDGEPRNVGIGDWLVDVGSQQLRSDSEFHALNPKEMGVLLHLAEASPDLVRTEELLDRSWPDVVVGDHVLHEVVGRLRRMLGDSARQPKYIETLRKRGYRLVAPVNMAPGAERRPRSVSSHPGLTVSLAVVAFEDLSPTQNLRWLAGHLRERLIVHLSRIDRLKLIRASYSVEHYGDATAAGQTLGATAILRGSVHAVGGSLLLSVHLVETRDGTQLWSADFDIGDQEDPEVPLETVIGIEAGLGLRVSGSVAEALDYARYGTNDVRAYRLWRRQLELKFAAGATVDDVRTALELNEQAVAIDPNYVMGHVGVGVTHRMLANRRSDLREVKHAERALERAVEIGPRHPIALANLAIMTVMVRDWARTVSLVQRGEPWTALLAARGVVQAYVWALVNLGQWADARRVLDETRRIMETAPGRHYALHLDIAEATFRLTGNVRVAVETFGDLRGQTVPGMVLPPEHNAPVGETDVQLPVWVHPRVALAYHYADREENAAAIFLAGLRGIDRVAARQGHADGGWEGMLLRVIENRRNREGVGTPSEFPYEIPTVDLLAALGEREAMYERLEQQQAMFECYLKKDAHDVHECGSGCWIFDIPIWTAPPYRRYLSEPRFQRLLDRYGVLGHRNHPEDGPIAAPTDQGPIRGR